MTPKQKKLADRVVRAAESTLAEQHYVSSIDVLVGIGWLDREAVRRWRRGQIAYLERGVQANLLRISTAMKLFRSWAARKGLFASHTEYVARVPGRPNLRFSKSGNYAIEKLYRTHWVSPELTEKKRARLAEKASSAPDLAVIQPLHTDWRCHRCGGTGDLLLMEPPGPACMRCVGLDDLEYLPAGDALLTRRAKAGSQRHAVVVRFSRSRDRCERRGLLVEPQAVAGALRELEKERAK